MIAHLGPRRVSVSGRGQAGYPVDLDRIRQAAESTGTMRIVGPPPF